MEPTTGVMELITDVIGFFVMVLMLIYLVLPGIIARMDFKRIEARRKTKKKKS